MNFQYLTLKQILRDIKKLYGKADRKERCPIIQLIFLHFLAWLNKNNFEVGLSFAVYILAFAAFLRIGELSLSKER